MNTVSNQVQLIGNLGQDPEFVTFSNGKGLCRFRIATNEFYRDRDGKSNQKTNWHTVVCWGKSGETMAKILRKGHKVAINGKLSSRSYETDAGSKKYVTEIVASKYLLLSQKSEALPF